MTREQFIQRYASASGKEAPYAVLGFIQYGSSIRIAMPCACEDKLCLGWAMIGPDSVDSHLQLWAPEPLRTAYCEAIAKQ